MNDPIMSWALSMLDGCLEIVEKQVKAREKVEGLFVQRIEGAYTRIEAIHADAERKQV